MQKKRLDQILLTLRLAKSRTQAQDFIERGLVYLHRQDHKIQLKKASMILEECDWKFVYVEPSEITRYVSRAGLKLEGAAEHLGLMPQGLRCLDIGISTGGFADFLLKKGAAHVVGVDVGHDQLAPSLREHPQLTLLEGVNARYLVESEIFKNHCPTNGFDLIVVDVSFISLTFIIPNLRPLLGKQGSFLGLVKPQFEVGPQGLDKSGIVNDPLLFLKVEASVREACQKQGLGVVDYFPSILPGKDGNQEFFVFAKLN